MHLPVQARAMSWRLGKVARCATQAATLAAALSIIGCTPQRYFRINPPIAATPSSSPVEYTTEHARHLPMFAGHDNIAVDWNDLLNAAAWADVIIIGELHDDAVGHAVQLAVVEDVLDRWPHSALSLEMLERDEQMLADDYLDNIIDVQTFIKLTFSEGWGRNGRWSEWYQPIIDATKDAGGRVVAANAPRRYVRLARTHGYERLMQLSGPRRQHFDLPVRLKDDSYRQRFMNLMNDDNAHGESKALHAAFRSQSLWDATMAASIARAKRAGATKVVHLVGQFHSDFNGGLVQQLRGRLPRAKILVISMQQDEVQSLRDEDINRADIVIYTGTRPPTDDEEQVDDADGADEVEVEEVKVDEDEIISRLLPVSPGHALAIQSRWPASADREWLATTRRAMAVFR